MIDIKFLRENPEVVKENIRKKFQDSKLPLVDEVIELDAESRKTQQEADDLRANRNKISKEIGALMAKGLKEEAEQKKAEVAAGAKRLVELEEKEKELETWLRGLPRMDEMVEDYGIDIPLWEKIMDQQGSVCCAWEKTAFEEGMKVGIRLMMEAMK